MVLDGVEDVGVGLAMPLRQVGMVGDVSGLRVFDVLVNLSDPAGCDEVAALPAGEPEVPCVFRTV